MGGGNYEERVRIGSRIDMNEEQEDGSEMFKTTEVAQE